MSPVALPLLLLASPADAAGSGAAAACGTELTTSIKLTADLDCTGYTGTIFAITADGVTIDGGGFTIIAPDAYAVVFPSVDVSEATVVDVTIKGGEYGVTMSAGRLTLQNVAVKASSYGVWFAGGELQVQASSIHGDGVGLALSYATGPFSISSDTTFGDGYVGVQLDGISNFELAGNTIWNPGAGVYAAEGVSDLTLTGVDLSASSGVGLSTADDTTAVVVDGVMFSGRDSGFSGGAIGATVSGSLFLGNRVGIDAFGSDWTVSGSYFCGNTTAAFVDDTTAGVTVLTGNYWGSPTGPTHPANPSGTGDTLDAPATASFSPWNLGDSTAAKYPECLTSSSVTCYEDEDGDGTGGDILVASTNGECDGSPITGDCDDHDPKIQGPVDWYRDGDGDGWGREDLPKRACDGSDGWAAQPGDCDDALAFVHPGAEEICDGIDDNCDGGIDEDFLYSDWYVDLDGDGFGDPQYGAWWFCDPGPGYALDGTDCDDGDAGRNPGAAEICNDQDDDCDDVADDGLDGLWYIDGDADGIGADRITSDLCAAPEGFVALSGDCDDGDPKIGEECQSWMSGGGRGCSTAGAPTAAWLAALLLLARRSPWPRASRPPSP